MLLVTANRLGVGAGGPQHEDPQPEELAGRSNANRARIDHDGFAASRTTRRGRPEPLAATT